MLLGGTERPSPGRPRDVDLVVGALGERGVDGEESADAGLDLAVDTTERVVVLSDACSCVIDTLDTFGTAWQVRVNRDDDDEVDHSGEHQSGYLPFPVQLSSLKIGLPMVAQTSCNTMYSSMEDE